MKSLEPFVGKEVSLQLKVPWVVHGVEQQRLAPLVQAGRDGSPQPLHMLIIQGVVHRCGDGDYLLRVDNNGTMVDVVVALDCIVFLNVAGPAPGVITLAS